MSSSFLSLDLHNGPVCDRGRRGVEVEVRSAERGKRSSYLSSAAEGATRTDAARVPADSRRPDSRLAVPSRTYLIHLYVLLAPNYIGTDGYWFLRRGEGMRGEGMRGEHSMSERTSGVAHYGRTDGRTDGRSRTRATRMV